MKASKASQIVWAILGIVVIIGVVAGVYWAASSSDKKSTKQASETSQQMDHDASSKVTISYTNAGFPSKTFMVKAGGTVTVENNSDHDLEFSSGPHPTHNAEPELNMDVLHAGESGSFKVTKIGTWSFHNHLKDEDTGSLMVM